jgi:hypothetical protein
MWVKLLQSFSYLLVLGGSWGMMQFVRKFPFSANLRDVALTFERWLGLNGYQVWKSSWGAFILLPHLDGRCVRTGFTDE